jgi:hypothetical protein
MSNWELYGTWAMLAIIGLGISSLARAINAVRDDVADLRRRLLGDENEPR